MHLQCKHPVWPFGGRLPSLRGFSLVEIVLAMGIVSFAFLVMLGLLPTGLKTFRRAIDTSVTSHIFQRVVNEAQQTDFNLLVGNTPPIRYFDNQGNECNLDEAIYYVNTRILPSTELPGAPTDNANLATVTVQVAANPGKVSLDLEGDLWKTKAGVDMTTYSTMVARSK